MTTTAYNSLTSGQKERNKNTIVTRLRHFVAPHQLYWDVFGQPMTYVCNTEVHQSISPPVPHFSVLS